MAAAYRDTIGVPSDRAHAVALLDTPASSSQGTLQEARTDAVRAAALFDEGCAAGLVRERPCREAGFLYFEGGGPPAAKPKAARLFERGCALQDDWCCFKLGTMLRTGDGIAAAATRAAERTRGADGLELASSWRESEDENKRQTRSIPTRLAALRAPSVRARAATPRSAQRRD
jgi:TPR repeat protein